MAISRARWIRTWTRARQRHKNLQNSVFVFPDFFGQQILFGNFISAFILTATTDKQWMTNGQMEQKTATKAGNRQRQRAVTFYQVINLSNSIMAMSGCLCVRGCSSVPLSEVLAAACSCQNGNVYVASNSIRNAVAAVKTKTRHQPTKQQQRQQQRQHSQNGCLDKQNEWKGHTDKDLRELERERERDWQTGSIKKC